MSEPKDKIEQTLEVLLYAPIGVGMYLKEMGPTFVARGRAEVDRRHSQVQRRTTTAKSIGQVAVGFGVPMVRAARRARGRQRPPARAVVPRRDRQRDPERAGPDRAVGTRHRAERRRDPDRSARATNGSTPAGDTLPIPGYDALSASQVVERLAGLYARRARIGTRLRKRAPQSAHDSRQDRPDLLLGAPWKTRESRPTADIARVRDLARLLRADLRSERGGPLWSVRESRPEPLDAAFAALLDRDDATVLVGTLEAHVVGLRRRGGRDPARRIPAGRHQRALRAARGTGSGSRGVARRAPRRVLHRRRMSGHRRDRPPRRSPGQELLRARRIQCAPPGDASRTMTTRLRATALHHASTS